MQNKKQKNLQKLKMIDLINSSLLALKKKNIPNPELDLRILLRSASFSKKEIILSNFDIKDLNVNHFQEILKKRLQFKPISKIINTKSFWKDDFYVNSDVLDPRPETELIIEEVLNNFKVKEEKLKILDIGTGSGCLAISLAKEFINSEITAIDVSQKALFVAKKNINKCNLSERINLKLSDIKNLNEKFDIIVSNPPYLSNKEYKNLKKEVKKYEPSIALLGGKDGLKFYRKLAKEVVSLMKINSIFICEIGFNQLIACQNIFKNKNLVLKKISKDIQKIDRTLTFLKI